MRRLGRPLCLSLRPINHTIAWGCMHGSGRALQVALVRLPPCALPVLVLGPLSLTT